MKEAFKILFLNEQGRISWTAVAAIASLILFVHTYIDIWWLGKQYDAALLSFALEIILVGLGVRGAQRGLQFLGEGVAGISSRQAAPKFESNKKTAVASQQATNAPLKSNNNQIKNGNFKVEEFNSKDGAPMPEVVRQNVIRHIANLEVIRQAIGNRPITITSGYRSKAHNAKVGGKPSSQHLLGNAADIQAAGVSPTKLRNVIKKLMDDGKIEAGGLKAYKTFVHYDRRGDYVTW